MSTTPHIESGRGRPTTLISYASEDEKAAAEVADKLLSAGYGVWLDKYSLLAGQDWAAEIRTAVAQVDAVVFLISRNSMKTGFVQKELKLALDLADHRPAGRGFLFPLRLDDTAVPAELARWQLLDMREPVWFRRLQSGLDSCAEDLAVETPADQPHLKILHVDFGADADVLTIDYVLRSAGPAALVDLGASLVDEDGRDYFHVGDDRRLWVTAGTAVYRRYLRLSALPRPGTYRLVVSVSVKSTDRRTRLASATVGEPVVLR